MSNINFELNLNKHPKDVTNRSLVFAKNVQVSDDNSCLQSEYAIIENRQLKELIGTDTYIAGYIPCNKEFILFIAPGNWKQSISESNDKCIDIEIYRIREQGDLEGNYKGSYDLADGKLIYNQLKWYGGKIKGTFTYNIKSQLIIAFTEYDNENEILVPLKTMNLGTWDSNAEDIFCDLNLTDDKLSLNPEIKIPSIEDFNYVNGLSYKGWYTFFIRYKINSVDYTKWYHIGFPVFLDELEKVQIFNYFIANQEGNSENMEFYNLVTQTPISHFNHYDNYLNRLIKTVIVTRGYPEVNNGKIKLDNAVLALVPDILNGYYSKNGWGAIDYISSTSNTCNTTLELLIDNKSNDFQYYQIGCIISTKDNIRAFKTLDLKYDNDSISNQFKFYLNISTMEEYSSEELLRQQYNYYNVKNVINYKNRLYLSNYKENNFKDNINLEELANQLEVGIYRKYINLRRVININEDIYEIKYFYYSNITQQLYTINHNQFIIDKNNYLNSDISYNLSGSDYTYSQYIDSMYIYLYKNNEYIDRRYISLSFEQYSDSSYVAFVNDNINFDGIEIYNYFSVEREGAGSDLDYRIIKDPDVKTTRIRYNKIDNSDSFYKNTYHKRLKNSTLVPGNYYKLYVHFVNKYGEYTNGIQLKNIINYDIDFIDIDYKQDYSFSITLNENNINFYENEYSLYNIHISNNININNCPKDIVGYFISYEKVQTTVKLTGYMVPYNYRYIHNNDTMFKYYPDDEEPKNKKWRFYCADIDLYDYIEVNFKQLILEEQNFTKPLNNSQPNDYIRWITVNKNDDTSFANNANIINKGRYCNAGNDKINIKSASVVLAHSFSKNNQFRGSYIELELENDDFDKQSDIYQKREYKVSLLADDTNLYLSENKVLIKLSDVIDIDKDKDIKYGYDGHLTYNNFLIYNNNQVILNSGYNLLVGDSYYSYLRSNLFTLNGNPEPKINNGGISSPMAYISMLIYSNKIYEAKCFNVPPEIYPVRTQPITSEYQESVYEFQNNIIVLPQNSVNLFKDRFGVYDGLAPITYTNYINNFITEFNKRIIRSNVIADESFVNSWRGISTEAYKDITENKGNITNIVAIGTIFLIHTEHGLFMFDRNNTLKNGDGDTMQLSMPDVFDIDYKEVFTSDLGVCGLQDMDAWIVDEFGYIFYDNDAHKFYKFNSKKIAEIDGNICQFINKYKPYKIRFANDCESNRLLVNIQYIDNINDNNLKEVTLSYNYKLNKWISFHDYCFDRAFFTKQMTYLIIDRNNENINYSNIYLINRFSYNEQNKITGFQNEQVIKNLLYNKFDNIRIINNDKPVYDSELHIMVNDSYEIMKTLEYITWKLYKIKELNDNELDYTPDAREKTRHPYSGTTLRIYNDNCDTGDINIFVDENNFNKSVMNYDKPWWEFGNWNFNNLRDIKNKPLNKIGADLLSRLYGNYFIICIKFNSTNDLSYWSRIEFETFDCKLINNPTI